MSVAKILFHLSHEIKRATTPQRQSQANPTHSQTQRARMRDSSMPIRL